jgi:hypothetical protein
MALSSGRGYSSSRALSKHGLEEVCNLEFQTRFPFVHWTMMLTGFRGISLETLHLKSSFKVVSVLAAAIANFEQFYPRC